MPLNAWTSIEGQAQGPITSATGDKESAGDLLVAGHEDEILVWAWNHEVTVPTDLASGQATGKRVHKPVIITKAFDKSSPLLYSALCNGETLNFVETTFYRIFDSNLEPYFVITLSDARVVNIKSWMPTYVDPSMAHLQQMEDVSFQYGKIVWNHLPGNTDYANDWKVE